jgi:hypothetical protein
LTNGLVSKPIAIPITVALLLVSSLNTKWDNKKVKFRMKMVIIWSKHCFGLVRQEGENEIEGPSIE